MIREHAEAILALLRTAPGTTPLVVLDGVVPTDPATGKSQLPPYVLVYFADSDPEDADSRSAEDTPGRYVVWAYCHCVGGNADAARKIGDRVRTVLLGAAPVVAGRSCFPIRREDGSPPGRDESTGALVMDKVDVYRLASEPA
ncbi:hypothetical protein [Micromonospora chersina]|uniref:hypothetical protein n=1 Tax=Micromonospora chersina TaxID=47854 RepID=UPI003408A39C